MFFWLNKYLFQRGKKIRKIETTGPDPGLGHQNLAPPCPAVPYRALISAVIGPPPFPSRNPKPNLLRKIPRVLLWPDNRVQGGLAGENVCFGGTDPLGALDDFPEEEQGEVNRDADVGRDEVIFGPRFENVEPVEEDDDAEEEEGGVRDKGLEVRFEDEVVAVDALSLEGLVELDVGNADADPGEEVGNCG